MKKLRGLQTYKSIAFSYKQIPLTHFIIRRFPFSFLNTLPSVISLVFPADEIRSQKKQDNIYFTEAAAMRSAAFFTISLAESVVRTEKTRYLSPYFIT